MPKNYAYFALLAALSLPACNAKKGKPAVEPSPAPAATDRTVELKPLDYSPGAIDGRAKEALVKTCEEDVALAPSFGVSLARRDEFCRCMAVHVAAYVHPGVKSACRESGTLSFEDPACVATDAPSEDAPPERTRRVFRACAAWVAPPPEPKAPAAPLPASPPKAALPSAPAPSGVVAPLPPEMKEAKGPANPTNYKFAPPTDNQVLMKEVPPPFPFKMIKPEAHNSAPHAAFPSKLPMNAEPGTVLPPNAELPKR